MTSLNKANHFETEHQFVGIHVFGEMYGIDPALLDNVQVLSDSLKAGIILSGATLCGLQEKKFEPQGVTLLGLLSESHASVHTYPDMGSLFFDAFTCGKVCQPEKIAEKLIEILKPTHFSLKTIERGGKSEREVAVPVKTASVEHYEAPSC